MQDILLENGYTISLLGQSDYSAVTALNQRCADHYLLHNGRVPREDDTSEIFLELPPGKDYPDKFVLGVFSAEKTLVGIIDLICNYKSEEEWTLGLMLLDPAQRGKGLGRTVHTAIIAWAKARGATSFRLGVIEDNLKGQKFWSSLGYKKISEKNMRFDDETKRVNVMSLQFPLSD